jgi:hypothetical protein
MEAPPYAAASNDPPLDELLAQLRTVHRQEPDCVQLILRTQHEDWSRSVAAQRIQGPIPLMTDVEEAELVDAGLSGHVALHHL